MTRKLLVALGLAAISAVTLWLYARNLHEEVVGGEKKPVLVAASDIPAGTRLTKNNLAYRDVPESYRHPATIGKGDETQVLGRPVMQRITQGQPLLWSDFESQVAGSSAGRLSEALQKGQRALTLPVDLSSALSGMLRPGDHVDVLGTFSRAQGGESATVTLLQNVLVLATGAARGATQTDDPNQPHSFNSITVAVDLEEAELLVFAMQRGPINVVLRSKDDLETVEDVPEKNFGDIFENTRRTAFAKRRAQRKIEALRPR